ncbi:MAG: phasin family protein [Desulfobacterales bacterium]
MENPKDYQKAVKEKAHNFFLAGLGALSFVGEKGNRILDDLIKKGKEFETKEKEGSQGAVQEKLMEMKKKVEKYGETFETVMDEKLKKVINKIGLPTRDEISGLTKRVEVLMANVESVLKKQRQKGDTTGKPSSKDISDI